MHRFWTKEKLEALKKLAELSTRFRPNGTQLRPLKWEDGLEKLKTQDYEAYKVIEGISIRRIKSAWIRYQNVVYGYCSTTMCGNKVKGDDVFCPKCWEKRKRMKAKMYSGYIYSRSFTQENRDLVRKSIAGMTVTEARKIIEENIGYMRVDLRKKILGSSYKKAARERAEESPKDDK